MRDKRRALRQLASNKTRHDLKPKISMATADFLACSSDIAKCTGLYGARGLAKVPSPAALAGTWPTCARDLYLLVESQRQGLTRRTTLKSPSAAKQSGQVRQVMASSRPALEAPNRKCWRRISEAIMRSTSTEKSWTLLRSSSFLRAANWQKSAQREKNGEEHSKQSMMDEWTTPRFAHRNSSRNLRKPR